ncbi:WD-40 repeat-containing protein [Rhizobiales bacterium GAS191]|nr:WD-40 repeat-containing protein [Rhizobiales bacterium GAS191]
MRDWLAAEGWDDVFLDLDPDRGIAPGERWERSLHTAANRCEAVIFLVSANWLASGWCLKEHYLARSLNKKLFAVLIDPSKKIGDLPSELTGTWQVISLTGGQDMQLFRVPLPGSHEEKHVGYSRDGLRRLKRGLEKAGLDPKYFPWPPESEPRRSPYRGLKPLEEADAGIFFGRDAPIVEAADRLRGLLGGAPPRLLVILGASGAGKSSFLRAGLLPRLSRDDLHFVPLPPIRPERAALTGENGLLGALEAALSASTRADLRQAIAAGANGLRPLLAAHVAKAQAERPEGDDLARPPAIVIAVDQAEELFRADGAEEGAALLALLRELIVADDPAVIAIFAIRSDAYDQLQHAKPLEGLPQEPFALLPMPRGAYTEVIAGPARRLTEAGGKLALEPQLTQRLLEDVEKGGGSDALPLLAFTLEQLYLEHGRAGALKLADYEGFGGLKGAIDAAVKRAFIRADADPRIPRERAARETLLRRGLIPWLAGIDPDSKSPRRNIARRGDIPPEAEPLIEFLVDERLLSTDTLLAKDPQTQAETRVATIEPAHEALLRQWGLLHGWLAEDFALLATLEGVKRAARDWDANGRVEAWLAHQRQRLSEAQGLDGRPDIAARLDATDRSYLAQCLAREEVARAEAEQRRREREGEQARRLADSQALATSAQALAGAHRLAARRTAIGFVAALALAVAAAGFGFYAQHESTIADERTQEAQAQRQAAENAASEAQEQRNSAESARQDASKRAAEARRNQSAALAALSSAALFSNPARAVKVAMAAWPRRPEDQTPQLGVALTALGGSVSELRERRILRGHHDGIRSAAFSPNGSRVVTASKDKTARLWDAATGNPIAILSGHLGEVESAAFSPDGARVVTVADDKTARVWDGTTGKPLGVLGVRCDIPYGATFSPDGTRILTVCNDWTVLMLDAETGRPIAVLQHYEYVNGAAFSPDGTRIVTTSADKTAGLWDGTSGKLIALLEHASEVRTASFSGDSSRLVTASDDKTARLWDAATGKAIAVLKGHDDAVLSAAFSPDGARIVTASYDRTARLWKAETGDQISKLEGYDKAVLAATFSPDGSRILTTSADRTARLLDASSGDTIAVLRGHGDGISSAAFSPDGTFVITSSYDGTARLWDAAIGKPNVVLTGHDSSVESAAFSPDGTRIVTASDDNTARVWNAATGQALMVLRGPSYHVRAAAFSPDGSRIATTSADKAIRLWDAASGNLIRVFDFVGDVMSAAFSPDGSLILTSSYDGTARLWDVATGKQMAIFQGHSNWVQSAAFSPDGARIVTASLDMTARIWDAASGKTIVVLKGHDGPIASAVFSPDGTLIVTASRDGTARLWDAAKGRLLAIFRGHSDKVNGASFSPDGTRVVTASSDGTARLWDVATGQPLVALRGQGGAVESATFSPDGTHVLTAVASNTARVWDIGTVPRGNLFQIACTWLPDHDLTDVATEYGLTDLEPICEGDPPLPGTLTK